jgi:AraC-like DNA-binding protein
MTNFRFISVPPPAVLSPYIAKIRVFESSGRLPAMERKLIVPNANFKLTFSYRNGIAARIGDKTFLQRENELTLTGLIDAPVILDPHDDSETGTIIIEFNPLGAYRFFHLSYMDIKNQIVDLGDLIGYSAATLRDQLAGAFSLTHRLNLLQIFLTKQLAKTTADPIFDYCIYTISKYNGLVTVRQLEKETGYSSRWLHTKFSENLGTGPKNLSEIVRFKQFYQAFAAGDGMESLKQQIYGHYHDQSHFIRAFKRFTGATPTELQHSMNELATRHFAS